MPGKLQKKRQPEHRRGGPWAQTAANMDDFGYAGWRDMVCVESANAVGNSVRVGPNASHVMGIIYSAEAN